MSDDVTCIHSAVHYMLKVICWQENFICVLIRLREVFLKYTAYLSILPPCRSSLKRRVCISFTLPITTVYGYYLKKQCGIVQVKCFVRQRLTLFRLYWEIWWINLFADWMFLRMPSSCYCQVLVLVWYSTSHSCGNIGITFFYNEVWWSFVFCYFSSFFIECVCLCVFLTDFESVN